MNKFCISTKKYLDFRCDMYSGVPNRSAARLLISEDFSFQHKLIWSNIFIVFRKVFPPTDIFGNNALIISHY